MSMEELHHQPRESLESARDPDRRADADEHVLGGLDVDLELARLVDGRVEQGK